jgi:hypothetical protein
LVAVITLLGGGVQSANADSGRITLTVYKAGWFIGGSGGGGTLTFHGRHFSKMREQQARFRRLSPMRTVRGAPAVPREISCLCLIHGYCRGQPGEPDRSALGEPKSRLAEIEMPLSVPAAASKRGLGTGRPKTPQKTPADG